jgi:hypothetical protein
MTYDRNVLLTYLGASLTAVEDTAHIIGINVTVRHAEVGSTTQRRFGKGGKKYGE